MDNGGRNVGDFTHLCVAVLSAGAGLVHFAAARDHGGVSVAAFALIAAVQVLLAVWLIVLPSAWAMASTGVVNGFAAASWIVSRTWGLPWPEEMTGVQVVGTQDLIAALLSVGAAVLGVLYLAGRVRSTRPASFRTTVVLAFVGVFVAATTGHAHGDSRPDQSVAISAAGEAPERFPAAEAQALLALSARPTLGSGGGHSHESGAGHGLGYQQPDPPAELEGSELEEFEAQWALARAAGQRLSTIEAAETAGYVLTAPPVPGVGAHWIKWSLVDQPFDPSSPSMLLFDTITAGRPPALVGLSYWVASADAPEGFAGPNDEWHTHEGMCFIAGWLREEGVQWRQDCDGIWIDGIDLWMLHAWSVETVDNPWGPFAAINPRLCPRPDQVPDALSCDPVGR